MTSVLIIGCGDVGCRVGRVWRGRRLPVRGLVRSAARAEALREAGISPIRADLDDDGALPALPADGAVLYYFAPPSPDEEGDPRLDRIIARIEGRPERVVYISTSGVYGDRRGQWVTEDTPVSPATPRARRRWAAEQALVRAGHGWGVPVCRLRVPGIYGPQRLPVARIEQGQPVVRASEAPYTNRIHVEDLARVCAAFGEGQPVDGVFNVSDGDPTTMTEYFNRVADCFGLPRPPTVSLAAAREAMSPAMYSFWRESRRLDTGKLHRTLDIALAFPSLEAGLADALRRAGR